MARPVSTEPEWFHLQTFSREVVHYSIRMFSHGYGPNVESLMAQPLPFQQAVFIVGKGVYCIQMIIRKRLREMFIGSMWLMARVDLVGMKDEICQFMDQGYLNQDIFKTTITCFAVIAELILFLSDLGRPVPQCWHFAPFSIIYMDRLRSEFLNRGGWEEFLRVTESRYMANNLRSEMFVAYTSGTRVPHAEVARRRLLPLAPITFLQEKYDLIIGGTELATCILNKILDQGLIRNPLPHEREV